MKNLKIGERAPAISSVDQNGDAITLEQFKGSKVVLYFYPKDMTPGCTMQSCNLRDNYQTLLDNGYVVLGCSADSPERHQKFIAKHNLPFSLISDESKEVLNEKDYQAIREKTILGSVIIKRLQLNQKSEDIVRAHFEKTVEPTQISEELSNEFGTAVEAKIFGDDDQLKLTTKYKIKEESADVDKEVNEKFKDWFSWDLI